MGVGVSYPCSRRAFKIGSIRFKSLNDIVLFIKIKKQPSGHRRFSVAGGRERCYKQGINTLV